MLRAVAIGLVTVLACLSLTIARDYVDQERYQIVTPIASDPPSVLLFDQRRGNFELAPLPVPPKTGERNV